MDTHLEHWRALLQQVQGGQLSVEEALSCLRDLPYEDLGFARVDHHRALRRGFTEVVFCQGKTSEQTVRIVQALAARSPRVLATRCSAETAAAIREVLPHAEYHPLARAVIVSEQPLPEPPADAPLVLVVSAGTSAFPCRKATNRCIVGLYKDYRSDAISIDYGCVFVFSHESQRFAYNQVFIVNSRRYTNCLACICIVYGFLN